MGVYSGRGPRLHYRTAGQGPDLVLLHGLGSSSQDWEYQIPEMSQHYRVIAPDFRGFGASDRTGPYSIEQFCRDTWALLDHLEIHQVRLLGYSMGGAVAMQMALERPQQIQALVLSNTLPSFRINTLSKRLMLWSRLLMMALLGPRRLSERVARSLFPKPTQAALREKVALRNSRNDRWVYLDTIRALVRWSVKPRLQELQVPALVLAAEKDYFPREDVLDFVAGLPNARLHILPGTRHGMPQGDAETFNRNVLDFLRTVERPPLEDSRSTEAAAAAVA